MERREDKIKDAVARCDCDAVMAVGADNFNYLSGTVLPFAWNYPERKAVVVLLKGDEGFVVCPFDWSEAVKDQGWRGEVVAYDENDGMPPDAMVKTLSQVLSYKGMERSKIGVDASRASRGLMEALAERMPQVEWRPVDPLLRGLRIVKTPEEVSLIEAAARHSDRGIVNALNHLEGAVESPGYTIAEFSERVRVHVCESGGSGVGHLSTTIGSDSQLYYTPPRGRFKNGELFRVDVSSHYKGYWAKVGRMGVTGKPTPEQSAAYRDNLRLKAAALETLKPGVACNEVYVNVKKVAERERIPLWAEVGIGHGLGTSHHEPPYLNLSDPTVLREGMVIALDVYTYGPRRELIHSVDAYEVVERGSRLLSWYRDWDRLYAVTGFRAAH